MKKFIGYLFFALIILSFTTQIACKKKDTGPNYTEKQQQAILLEGTWSVSAVVTKPADVAESEVSDLTFTFGIDADKNPTTFSAGGTSAANYFVTTGSSTWDFAGSSTTTVQLSNDVGPVNTFTIGGDVTETTMTVSFTLTTARLMILDGDYTLTMTK